MCHIWQVIDKRMRIRTRIFEGFIDFQWCVKSIKRMTVSTYVGSNFLHACVWWKPLFMIDWRDCERLASSMWEISSLANSDTTQDIKMIQVNRVPKIEVFSKHSHLKIMANFLFVLRRRVATSFLKWHCISKSFSNKCCVFRLVRESRDMNSFLEASHPLEENVRN